MKLAQLVGQRHSNVLACNRIPGEYEAGSTAIDLDRLDFNRAFMVTPRFDRLGAKALPETPTPATRSLIGFPEGHFISLGGQFQSSSRLSSHH